MHCKALFVGKKEVCCIQKNARRCDKTCVKHRGLAFLAKSVYNQTNHVLFVAILSDRQDVFKKYSSNHPAPEKKETLK